MDESIRSWSGGSDDLVDKGHDCNCLAHDTRSPNSVVLLSPKQHLLPLPRPSNEASQPSHSQGHGLTFTFNKTEQVKTKETEFNYPEPPEWILLKLAPVEAVCVQQCSRSRFRSRSYFLSESPCSVPVATHWNDSQSNIHVNATQKLVTVERTLSGAGTQ